MTSDGRADPFSDVRTVVVDGIDIGCLTLSESADRIVQAARERRGGLVLTHNLEHLRQVRTSPIFRQFARQADLAVADGMPLVWASRLAGTPLPGRVNGTDLLLHLLERLDDDSLSVYFAGGLDDTAERTASKVERHYPYVRVAGAHSPPPALEGDVLSIEREAHLIAAVQPSIVFIGLPTLLQASLGAAVRRQSPTSIVIGVGVSFSYLCGDLKRAPVWMQRSGLEWLYRLMTQPRDLGSRYLIRCAPLGVRLLTSSVLARCRGRSADRN